MFCKNCGTKLNEGIKFCVKCGTQVSDIDGIMPNGSNGVVADNKFSFLTTWIYLTIALGILMIILFGLVGSFENGFLEPFIGTIILAALLGVMVTLGIKWRKKGFVFESVSISELSPKEASKLKGIDGWLILVILNLFIVASLQIYSIFSDIKLFANGTVDFLSDPSSSTYIPAYGGFLKFELIVSIVLVFSAVYLIYLFFRKSRRFPKYYIVFLVASAVYVGIDYTILSLITVPVQAKQILDEAMSEQGIEMARAFIGVFVWGSYMVKSKRVKITFTE